MCALETLTGDRLLPTASGIEAEAVATVGEYQLEDEVGRGGIGVVNRAHDRRLDRHVAIKQLQRPDPLSRLRFEREMRVTARLQHPGVVPIYECGQLPDGAPYYAMRLIEGRSLKELVAEQRTLEERLRLVTHVRAVAETVAYAHSKGIIHRDIKPANVITGTYGETLLIDWGLAKELEGSGGVTLAGDLVGTPAYMPPEQAGSGHVDYRVDVYALGALLYHVVAGVPPYGRRDGRDTIRLLLHGPPTPLEQLQPGVPADLAAVVAKAMAREPRDRYPSAQRLVDELERFQTGQLVHAREYPVRTLVLRWLHRHRAMVGLSASFLVLLVVLGVVGVQRILREARIADQQRALADANRDDAEARANELVLTQARASLDTDPTRTLAWLKRYHADGEKRIEARNLAADALSRGVARLVLSGHRNPILGADFSPDGKLLYSYAVRDELHVWDTSSGLLLHLARVGDRRPSVAMAPDGELLAYAGSGGRVRIWDRRSGHESTLETGATGGVKLAFSPDGGSIAVAATGSPVEISDLKTGARSRGSCAGSWAPLAALRFTPDGSYLVSVDEHGSLSAWDRRSGACKQLWVAGTRPDQLLVAPHDDVMVLWDDRRATVVDLPTGTMSYLYPGGRPVVGATLSPSGDELAFMGDDGCITIMNRATGALRSLKGGASRWPVLAYSHDGRRLAIGANDGTTQVWDLRTEENWTLHGHRSRVNVVRFSPDDTTLVTGSVDTELRLWPVPTRVGSILSSNGAAVDELAYSPDGTLLAALVGNRARVWLTDGSGTTVPLDDLGAAASVAFSANGRVLASRGWSGAVLVWYTTTGLGWVLGEANRNLYDLALSPEATLTGGDDGRVREWKMGGGRGRELRCGTSAIHQVAASNDGAWVAAGGEDGTLCAWSEGSDSPQILVGHTDAVSGLEFSKWNRLVSASSDGTVRVWDLLTGTGMLLVEHADAIRTMHVSPDGLRVASADDRGHITIAEIASASTREITGPASRVLSVQFSPDGQSVVAAFEDRTARVWDVSTGEAWVLRGHAERVTSAVFSPDGSVVATGSDDGTVRLWNRDAWHREPADASGLARWLDQATNLRIDLDPPAGS